MAELSDMERSVAKFKVNDTVFCHDGKRFYKAKITDSEFNEQQNEKSAAGVWLYCVHYHGWNKRFDEVVTDDRLMEFNADNEKKVNEEVAAKEAADEAASKLKPAKTTDDASSSKVDGVSSRASTPPSLDSRPPKSARLSHASDAASASKDKRRKLGGGASAAADARTTAGRLQAHVEPPGAHTRRPEIRVQLPLPLKQLLVDDSDLIVRQYKLVRLPARVPADAIFERYSQAKRDALQADAQKLSLYLESCQGLRAYFNAALGTCLLYKFERPQYAELLETSGGGDASAAYGLVHLLRLFVRLGSMLAYTPWSEKSIGNILVHVDDFVEWLHVNKDAFYDQLLDYETASPEYQKKAYN